MFLPSAVQTGRAELCSPVYVSRHPFPAAGKRRSQLVMATTAAGNPQSCLFFIFYKSTRLLFLVDKGAEVSAIQPGRDHCHLQPSTFIPQAADSSILSGNVCSAWLPSSILLPLGIFYWHTPSHHLRRMLNDTLRSAHWCEKQALNRPRYDPFGTGQDRYHQFHWHPRTSANLRNLCIIGSEISLDYSSPGCKLVS